MGDTLTKKIARNLWCKKTNEQSSEARRKRKKEQGTWVRASHSLPHCLILIHLRFSSSSIIIFFPLPFREQWETWTTFYCPKPTIQNPQLFPQLGLNHLIYFYIITIYGFKFYNIGSIWLANLSTRYCKMWTDFVKCNTVIRFWMVMLLQLLLTSASWKSTLLWFQYLKRKKKVYNFTSSENKDVTNISPVDIIQTK